MRKLTGKYCHIPNLFGSLVLWVEIELDTPEPFTRWEKATTFDLYSLGLRL